LFEGRRFLKRGYVAMPLDVIQNSQRISDCLRREIFPQEPKAARSVLIR
jgi:hypothetical protein